MGGKLFPLPIGERVRVRGNPNSSKLHPHSSYCFSNSFGEDPKLKTTHKEFKINI